LKWFIPTPRKDHAVEDSVRDSPDRKGRRPPLFSGNISFLPLFFLFEETFGRRSQLSWD